MTREVKQLLALHERNEHVETDQEWYALARRECVKRATKLSVDYDTYVGVVAAMSPLVPWRTRHGKWPNLDMADAVIRGDGRGLPTSLARANRIMAGEPVLEVLGTAKTANFFRNLMGEQDAVTIDTWMVRAMCANPPSTQSAYDRLAQYVRDAAKHAGITPHALQASVWSQIKREQGSPNAIAMEAA